ncbi:MAG: Asp-tRNA(Asn)/Glu-tRNA(Gln) amidotransferase subunit GatB [Alphaproteobacteria bacterium]|nr:Asp-tRNA(Asn)/Glu-tRNA(Gln) amidotransferase subunit GatB [Alphaproteobacteria bacterium]
MMYTIKGNTSDWELVIGLEVHCQIISKAKVFSGASAEFGAEQNTHVSLVDAAFPGMLPVLNEECIRQSVKTGLGLNAKINKYSRFDRKNYFYADLPQGYQISQLYYPIVGEGFIEVHTSEGDRKIGVERLHLEQDAGKSIHDMHPTKTFIDLNRSGVGLMEIVSKPDMRSPEEAGEYLRQLRAIVRALGTCDGNMDEGSMRCDVNVSVRPVGDTALRTRAEVKNVNSVRFVMHAIEVEAKRQIEIYENGGQVKQETRLYDSDNGETRPMRGKENANDYRYFPDPDLLPVVLTDEYIENIRKNLPELPEAKKARYIGELGLPAYDAGVLTADMETANYFETAAKGHDAKKVANWVMGDLFAYLNKECLPISKSPITAVNLGALVGLIEDNTISGKIAKDVFQLMIETGKAPNTIVEEKGLKQTTDTGAIEKIVDEVMAANPTQVAEIKAGKDKLKGWWVGQIMKASQGKANPALANQILNKKLNG